MTDAQVGPGSNPRAHLHSQELLTPGEVARLFHVDPRTVTRWANEGRLPVIKTLGGHRRFPAAAVHELLSSPPEDF